MFLFLLLSVRLFDCVFVYVCCLSICLFMCLFGCLVVCMFVCFVVCLFGLNLSAG